MATTDDVKDASPAPPGKSLSNTRDEIRKFNENNEKEKKEDR